MPLAEFTIASQGLFAYLKGPAERNPHTHNTFHKQQLQQAYACCGVWDLHSLNIGLDLGLRHFWQQLDLLQQVVEAIVGVNTEGLKSRRVLLEHVLEVHRHR